MVRRCKGGGDTELAAAVLMGQETPCAARAEKGAAGTSRAQPCVSAQQPRGLGWVAVTEIVAGTWRVGDLDGEDGMAADHFAWPPRRAGSSISLAKEQLDLPAI